MKLQVFTLLILSIATVLVFQNCAKGGFTAGLEDSLSQLAQIENLTSSGALISSKSAGTFDGNCLTNSNYDACLFWKNPVAQRKGSYVTPLAFEANIEADQVFGVKLGNLKTPTALTSDALYVYFSGDSLNREVHLSLSAGQFRQSYQLDGAAKAVSTSSRSTAQLMAYFWLNHLQSELKTRTGTSYSEKYLTYVDAYATDPALDSSLRDNAFFTFGTNPADRFVVLGYSSQVQNSAVTPLHEMALSAEVYLHEMGHANLYAAKGNDPALVSADSNGQTYYFITTCTGDPSYSNDYTKNVGEATESKLLQLKSICDPKNTGAFKYIDFKVCKTNQGCFDAINEGQADFHFMMIFPEATGLGETVYNNPAGGFDIEPRRARRLVSGNNYQCTAQLINNGIKRNAALTTGLHVEDFFQGSGYQLNNCSTEIPGEIHGMGTAYASILWEIYVNKDIKQRIFEKAFQAHLQKLGSSSNFASAWMALRADYLAAGGDAIGTAVIDGIFARKGVIKP